MTDRLHVIALLNNRQLTSAYVKDTRFANLSTVLYSFKARVSSYTVYLVSGITSAWKHRREPNTQLKATHQRPGWVHCMLRILPKY